tara:strand:- start:352 stop:753 length:402 start_codon:yes stop_codon:yes gene_type:complete
MSEYSEQFYDAHGEEKNNASINENEMMGNYMMGNDTGNNESHEGPAHSDGPAHSNNNSHSNAPAPVEEFGNLNMNKFPVDLVLKSIFFGAIFYLLSLPEVYKMTKKCCKSVDGVLLHSIVFAILYFILVQFIN